MAYTCPHDLDGFLPHLGKPDTKFRQTLGADLLNYLAEPSNQIQCQDIGHLVDGLIPWMQSSNYKVSSNGIEVMTYLADRLGHDFRPYLPTVLPAVVDRLGDAKDTVREKSQLLILKLLERSVLSPQQLLERLNGGFVHKNAKIREEVLRCLVNTINEHGSQSITLNKFIPSIAKLMSDPTSTVRDTAFSTIVELYKHIGERLRMDLQKKNLIPAAKLPALLARFDEVKEAGEMLHSAIASDLAREVDEIDRVAMPKPAVPVKRAPVLNAVKRTPSAQSRTGGSASGPSAATSLNRFGSMRSKKPTPNSKTEAGAIDEDTFTRSFEDVPTTQIFSTRELNDQMNNIKDIISDTSKDWNKRVDALKKLRSLVIAGAASYEDFYTLLRNLEIPLQTSVKDLRSQVVREACITISYFSQMLGSKFDHAAEYLLPSIINLIQNSAKVMASSGHICVRFIIQSTQSSRLVPIITHNMATHKSKDIRRSCCEFLETILTQWSSHVLERHVSLLQDSIKKGIGDADPEARVISRRAFRAFKEHFPDQAEVLLQSLEPAYRKALHGELCLSSSSSSGSLAQTSTPSSATFRAPRYPYRPPTTSTTPHSGGSGSTSATGSTENLSSTSGGGGGLHRAPSLPRTYRQRSGIPVLNSNRDISVTDSGKRGGYRSNSAIDLQAAQRAKARAQYAAMSRYKITSGTASLQGEVAQQARPRKNLEAASMVSPERTGRTRTRTSGVSQSQPTSRSGSPSSRLSYATYGRVDHESPRPRRLSSGIPRSTAGSRDTSREASPTRGGVLRAFGSARGGSQRPPLSPASRPVMAQRILQQSLEAESALADALTFDSLDTSDITLTPLCGTRKHLRSLDNHSDDSETSSVCSERSFDSYRRPSDDINEIINNCASTVWQERKDGLVSLQHYLNNGNLLSKSELKIITEIFTKMFMDSHTKVLSLFLDTLNELILKHRTDLVDWLYVLLQRIFNKLGTEILSSLHKKINKTLELIKFCFPSDLQHACVYRFLVDNTQTPNTKVKVAVLTYLKEVTKLTEAGQFVSQPPASQALSKIIMYTQDSKSVEIRNAAKICLIALFNCNTAQMTMLLSELPKSHQDIAAQIVQTHVRKSSSGSEPGSPVVVGSPKTLSPQTPHARGDDINQEEIYKSLRRTTAEIQNYSFEALGISKLERDRDTTSQDSGISQMSAGGDGTNRVDGIASLEDRMEELSLHRANSYTTGAASPGVKHSEAAATGSGTASSLSFTVNGLSDIEANGYTIDDKRDKEIIARILDIEMFEIEEVEKRKILTLLYMLLKKKRLQPIIENFRRLLKILLDNLNDDYKTQILVLGILTEIFRTEELKQCYLSFVELLVIKILCVHQDPNKEVVRWAEHCAAAMAVCPFDVVCLVLNPLISTSEYPVNQAGIKMMTKLVEQHSSEITDQHLADIMPILIQAYDHEESPMRKCAVFCMVAIHKAVGEDRMAPYLESLVGSKRKLVHLYVKRAQQGSSVPTSPKNSAAS